MAKHATTAVVLGGALALGLSSSSLFAEGPTGKMLADTCAGCHGTNGNSVGPATPNISAMDPYVFFDMMVAFAEDEIYSTIMGRIARGYSEEEIERMAEFFHEQEYIPADQPYDASLVATGAELHEQYCAECHIEDGKPVKDEDDYYILAGQWTPYLRFAMEDFIAERREMPRNMADEVNDMFDAHGKESLESLYAFYAAVYSDTEDDNGDN